MFFALLIIHFFFIFECSLNSFKTIFIAFIIIKIQLIKFSKNCYVILIFDQLDDKYYSCVPKFLKWDT